MEGEKFSLCWNNFNNNMLLGFQSLLKDEDLVDVTLAAEGQYIKAHKIVLSVCSSYFKELFRANPCKHPIVILQDVSLSNLRNLLDFMYHGEVDVSQEEIPAFMKAAEVLKVKGLTENSSSSDGENFNGIQDDVQSQTSNQDMPVAIRNQQKLLRRSTKSLKSPSSTVTLQGRNSISHSSGKRSSGKSKSLDTSAVIKKPKIEEDSDAKDEFHNSEGTGDTSTCNENSDFADWDSKTSTDTSPGTLGCTIGKRGNVRLIVDGHSFLKRSTYKNKYFWSCKYSRTQKCPSICCTLLGRIIKWPQPHTHDIINEACWDEDTAVPAEKLVETLLNA